MRSLSSHAVLSLLVLGAPGLTRAEEAPADAGATSASAPEQVADGGAGESESAELPDGGVSSEPLAAGPDGGYPYGIDGRCLELAQETGPLGDIVGAVRLDVGGAHVPIQALRLTGLTTLDPNAVAKLVGVPQGALPQPLSPELAAVLVARLAATGLFEDVIPRVVEGPRAGVLEVELHEFPRLTGVEITGLTESRPEELLRVLLESPEVLPHPRRHHRPRFEVHVPAVDDALRELATLVPANGGAACAWARPPSSWLALPAGTTVVPGIIWHGVPRSIERMVADLRLRGYLLATAAAHLGRDGVLHVQVDEGRVTEVKVMGVDPAVEGRVRERLGIKAGDVLLASEVSRGIAQVSMDLPFLVAAESHHLDPGSFFIATENGADGTQTFRTVIQPAASPPPPDEDEGEDDRPHRRLGARLIAQAVKGAELHDRALVFYFEAHVWAGSDADWYEIFRHTQVTGFAPGLGGTLRYSDPGGRVNVAVDAQLNVNSRRPSVPATGDLLTQMNAQQRVDWLVGPKVQLPGLDIAELGVQAHALTDTTDRWHMDPLDSYLDSLWMNRPDSWYFRRSGGEAYVTVHILEHLTAGAEYRIDRYEGLTSLDHVWTIFNQDEHAFFNPTFGAVEVGSVLARLEYSTERRSIDKVGDRRRDPERSLIAWVAPQTTSYRSVNTLEVASPSLGGQDAFTRLVSDHVLYLASGTSSGFTLRVRGAGENGAVPLPKQESLGGWDALRGYGFDEFHGDRSLLGSAEYRWEILGVFTDVGAVRQLNGDWIAPRMGVGAELAFLDSVHFEAAWRTDSRATAAPSVRLLFARTF